VALDEKVRAFLNEPRFAVLATINPDGTCQQTVMWYKLRGDQIMLNTARGRKKDRNLLHDHRMSICVEDGYRYVTVAGVADLVEDQTVAQGDVKELAIRYHGVEQGEAMALNQFGTQERVSILLTIDAVDSRGFEEA